MRLVILFVLSAGCAAENLPSSGTRFYEYENVQLILCANSGFVINTGPEVFSTAGHYTETVQGDGTAIDGPSKDLAFYFTVKGHELVTADDGAPFQQVAAFHDFPDRDPASQCTNLEQRPWW